MDYCLRGALPLTCDRAFLDRSTRRSLCRMQTFTINLSTGGLFEITGWNMPTGSWIPGFGVVTHQNIWLVSP